MQAGSRFARNINHMRVLLRYRCFASSAYRVNVRRNFAAGVHPSSLKPTLLARCAPPKRSRRASFACASRAKAKSSLSRRRDQTRLRASTKPNPICPSCCGSHHYDRRGKRQAEEGQRCQLTCRSGPKRSGVVTGGSTTATAVFRGCGRVVSAWSALREAG
jgi:hypothetical protein